MNDNDYEYPSIVRFDLLKRNLHFKSEVTKLRKKFNIPDNGFTNEHLKNQWINDVKEKRFESWHKSIAKILIRANLMGGWRGCIEEFIIEGKGKPPVGMTLEVNKDEYGYVNVGVNINDAQLSVTRNFDSMQKVINSSLEDLGYKKLNHRNQPITSYKQYIQMLSMKEAGKSNHEIAQKVQGNLSAIEIGQKLDWIERRISDQMN